MMLRRGVLVITALTIMIIPVTTVMIGMAIAACRGDTCLGKIRQGIIERIMVSLFL
jgi:hypothetical protein